MARFNDKRRSNDRGGARFERRDRDEKEMFQTTCSNCGKACEVPFQPRGDRPVYCRDCFKKQDSRDFRGGDNRGGDRGRSNFGEKRMFSATCENCGNACEVPFRPTGEKPVYCSNCFEKMGNKHDAPRRPEQRQQAQPDFSNQLKALNNKLDLILSALIPAGKVQPDKVTKKEAIKPSIEKKAVVKPEAKKDAKKVKPKKAKK